MVIFHSYVSLPEGISENFFLISDFSERGTIVLTSPFQVGILGFTASAQ